MDGHRRVGLKTTEEVHADRLHRHETRSHVVAEEDKRCPRVLPGTAPEHGACAVPKDSATLFAAWLLLRAGGRLSVIFGSGLLHGSGFPKCQHPQLQAGSIPAGESTLQKREHTFTGTPNSLTLIVTGMTAPGSGRPHRLDPLSRRGSQEDVGREK